MGSSKFNETVNQFNIGDCVKVKGKSKEMIVVSNIPGGALNIEHYLKTDKFVCKWLDESGATQSATFNGADLECC